MTWHRTGSFTDGQLRTVLLTSGAAPFVLAAVGVMPFGLSSDVITRDSA
jgi:hypothetical protein